MIERISRQPKSIADMSDDELVLNHMLAAISDECHTFMINAVVNAGYTGIDIPWIVDSMIRQQLEYHPEENIARFCNYYTLELVGSDIDFFTRLKVFRKEEDKYYLSDLAMKHLGRFKESLKRQEYPKTVQS